MLVFLFKRRDWSKQTFLTPPQPSSSPQAPSTLVPTHSNTPPLPLTHNPNAMPRVASTPSTPKRHDIYHSRIRALAEKAWKSMSEDEKAEFRAKNRESSEVPSADGDFDLDEEEDLVNNIVSLSASPVKEEEQSSPSPLFSEVEPSVGPPAFGGSHPASPSVPHQVPSSDPPSVVPGSPLPGPSSANEGPTVGPSLTINPPFFSTSSPSESSPGSSESSPEPITVLAPQPLPANNFVNGANFSLDDQFAYPYFGSTAQVPELTFPQYNSWEAAFDSFQNGTYELELPTPVPPTPATGYTALQAPWYTPGLQTQGLPTGSSDTQFVFSNAQTAFPEQQTWTTNEHSVNCLPHLSAAPPTPAPVSAPALSPAPIEITTQSNHLLGLQGDQDRSDNVTYGPMFENNQLPSQFPLALTQETSLATAQNVFDAINVNNSLAHQEGKRIGLVGVQLWFLPK